MELSVVTSTGSTETTYFCLGKNCHHLLS